MLVIDSRLATSYPAGVTTNSADGVVDYDAFHEVFKAMEEVDLLLCLHGECPSHAGSDITTLNAESKVNSPANYVKVRVRLLTFLGPVPPYAEGTSRQVSQAQNQ